MSTPEPEITPEMIHARAKELHREECSKGCQHPLDSWLGYAEATLRRELGLNRPPCRHGGTLSREFTEQGTAITCDMCDAVLGHLHPDEDP